MIVTPSRSSSRWSAMERRISSTGPRSTGSQIASSRRISAACWIFGWCPSGKTMRVSFLRAFDMIEPITWFARLCILRSRSRYSVRSMSWRATPASMAAFATAGATQSRTRGSSGFGMM